MKCKTSVDVDKLLSEAAERMGEPYVEDISWWSWPEVFGSTAGPRGGIGGASMTTFQVFAFQGQNKRIKTCAGIWKNWDGELRW